jgi:hypothetical protein
MKSWDFSDICCGIFEKRWFSYGMVAPFIKERMLRHSWREINASRFTACPAMPLNLTRLNTSGHTASGIYPTAPMKTLTIWDRICGVPSDESETPSDFSNRASNILRFYYREF